MKNLRNNKSQRGFTLVEVIVVAIIVAALAGVAIPMYTNYVKTSQNNAAANAAGSVASWMGQCLNQDGTVSVTGGSGTTITTDGTAAVTLYCKKGTPAVQISTIALPPKITFSINKLSNSVTTPGQVVAKHMDGGDDQTYAY